MNYLPFALLAYLLNAIAVTIDKFLLTPTMSGQAKSIPNPLTYIFYISALSLLALLAIPFTNIPTGQVFVLTSLSTLFWTTGAYAMFAGLKIGQVSRVIPVIGTLTPIFLLIYDAVTGGISSNETWAAGILIFGLIIVTAPSWIGKINKKEILFEVLAALFFAISYVLLKAAYKEGDFLTVLVWGRIILIPLLCIVLLSKKVQFEHKPTSPLFFFGQSAGALSQFLLTFSISLASPALINSLQGIQYVFIFIFSLIFFKEKAKLPVWIVKIVGILLISLGLAILAFATTAQNPPKLGVTYSPRYANELGLDPKLTYVKMLDELSIKLVRIPVYWDEVEAFPNQLDLTQTDFYLNEARNRGVDVILVVGFRQPRWPECFTPVWVKHLTRPDREKRVLDLVRKEIEYFKRFDNIKLWQVENEPLLSYGQCEKVDAQTEKLLQDEVNLVKSLDPRPILITDSGELSLWIKAMSKSDIFGFTLYRQVWNPLFGVLNYPLPPAFYQLKNGLVRLITGREGESIVSELQAEPWLDERKEPAESEVERQARLMPVLKLKEYVEFAKETNFNEIILWGVEWWYFMAQNGHPEYLEYAKTIY